MIENQVGASAGVNQKGLVTFEWELSRHSDPRLLPLPLHKKPTLSRASCEP